MLVHPSTYEMHNHTGPSLSTDKKKSIQANLLHRSTLAAFLQVIKTLSSGSHWELQQNTESITPFGSCERILELEVVLYSFMRTDY
jgi:hypothetical protein